MKNFIGGLLIKLGINRTYLGHQATLCSVMIAIENEMSLLNIIRDIYTTVSETLNCKTECVERNIRTVIFIAWKNNKSLLEEISGIELDTPPTVSQFIDIIANYTLRNYEPEENRNVILVDTVNK